MNCLYLAPRSLIDGLKIGPHDAYDCPSSPGMCLLVVMQWVNKDSQDRFESDPTVLELSPWDADKPAPATLVAAFSNNKIASVSVADTIGSALWKIRAWAPAARY